MAAYRPQQRSQCNAKSAFNPAKEPLKDTQVRSCGPVLRVVAVAISAIPSGLECFGGYRRQTVSLSTRGPAASGPR